MVDLSNLDSYIQHQFLDDFYDHLEERQYRYFIYKSGRGAGKSSYIAMLLIMLSFVTKHNILVLQATYSAMKEASYSEIIGWIDELGLNDFFECKTAPLEIYNKESGCKFIFRGTDNTNKLKSIKDIEYIWFEEADLVPEDMFDVVDLSARGKGKKVKIFMSFNPSSPFVWIKKYIDEPSKYNAFVHTSFYYDNEFLDEAFILKMENLKENDYDRYRRDGLGEFTMAEGLCLDNTLIEDWKEGAYYGVQGYEFLGIDFGHVHPQALVHGTYYVDTNTLVLNHIIDKTGLTNEEFTKLIPKIYSRINNKWADSASPDKIKHLNQNGFNFKGANKLKLPVSTYIEFMNSLTKIVVKVEASSFKREAGKWEYMKDSDTPKKIDDDINDAIRYGLQPVLITRLSSDIDMARI